MCWVADFAWALRGKDAQGAPFLGYMIVSVGRRLPCGPRCTGEQSEAAISRRTHYTQRCACSEHAVGRAGYIGARLVGKVKDHSVSARMDRDSGENDALPSTMQRGREFTSLEQGLASTVFTR